MEKLQMNATAGKFRQERAKLNSKKLSHRRLRISSLPYINDSMSNYVSSIPATVLILIRGPCARCHTVSATTASDRAT